MEDHSSSVARIEPCGQVAPMGERPVRVQLRRTKGWKMPPNTVKVDRSTRWGNPFSRATALDLGVTSAANASAFLVDCFKEWVGGGPRQNDLWMGPESELARRPFQELSALRGKNLACWCKLGEPCHAGVLLEMANRPADPEQG